MNLQTKTTVPSERNPGVVFTLRRFTERRRIERELMIAPLRNQAAQMNAKIRGLLETTDQDEIEKDLRTALADPGRADQVNILLAERALFELKEWFPAWIKWGITKVDGFAIDDKPATIEQYCDEADRADLEEAYRIVEAASELPDESKKNLESPGTSATAVDGLSPSLIAIPAA